MFKSDKKFQNYFLTFLLFTLMLMLCGAYLATFLFALINLYKTLRNCRDLILNDKKMNADLELLSHWVLDEGKIVTNSFLLRQTNLDVPQSQQLFRDFLSHNVAREKVWATYFLLGEPADADTDDGIQRKKSLICKQADLEETKKQFKSIASCSIYSVQAQPLNDFHVLFNVNWQDSSSYLSPTKQKTLIRNPTAIKNYESWKNSLQKDEQLLDQANKKTTLNNKIKNEAKKKDNEKLVKKIENLFTKSIQATSPKKSKRMSSTSPEKNLLKKKLVVEEINETFDENANASPVKKARSGNILISSDDEIEDDKEDETLASVSSLAKKGKATRSSTAASKSTSKNTWETNKNDVFCTGEDSDEETNTWNVENVVERQVRVEGDASKVKKNKKLPTQITSSRKSKKGKHSKLIGCDSDDEQDEASDSNDRMEVDSEVSLQKSFFKNAANTAKEGERRQEKVVETFVDEDGFEVTHTVTRWVNNDVSDAKTGASLEIKSEMPSNTTPTGSAVLKSLNSANKSTTATKKKTALAPSAQPKISSFFTRKAE